MTTTLSKIYFVHEGKAVYPEINAYRDYFAGRTTAEEARFDELAAKPDLSRAICWHMMGFYPQRPAARLVIHDYRSLSVGRLPQIKDKIKRLFNSRPDIRIFQNEAVRDAIGFADGVPMVLLGMGVPAFTPEFRPVVRDEADYDFAYIGAMSSERRTDLMLDSFLRRFGSTKTFLLLGTPEPSLAERYRANANIIFAGRMSQPDVFRKLARTRSAVNYFPAHYPHVLQTPTKLLEYAALGLRILANEQPQSRRTAEMYGIHALWGSTPDLFRNVPDELIWDDNLNLDASPLLWPSVIQASGVSGLIAQWDT
jgi:hypothetical protein